MAFPAFLPAFRRSHLRSRIVSTKGAASGIIKTASGQISPEYRAFKRLAFRLPGPGLGEAMLVLLAEDFWKWFAQKPARFDIPEKCISERNEVRHPVRQLSLLVGQRDE